MEDNKDMLNTEALEAINGGAYDSNERTHVLYNYYVLDINGIYHEGDNPWSRNDAINLAIMRNGFVTDGEWFDPKGYSWKYLYENKCIYATDAFIKAHFDLIPDYWSCNPNK